MAKVGVQLLVESLNPLLDTPVGFKVAANADNPRQHSEGEARAGVTAVERHAGDQLPPAIAAGERQREEGKEGTGGGGAGGLCGVLQRSQGCAFKAKGGGRDLARGVAAMLHVRNQRRWKRVKTIDPIGEVLVVPGRCDVGGVGSKDVEIRRAGGELLRGVGDENLKGVGPELLRNRNGRGIGDKVVEPPKQKRDAGSAYQMDMEERGVAERERRGKSLSHVSMKRGLRIILAGRQVKDGERRVGRGVEPLTRQLIVDAETEPIVPGHHQRDRLPDHVFIQDVGNTRPASKLVVGGVGKPGIEPNGLLSQRQVQPWAWRGGFDRFKCWEGARRHRGTGFLKGTEDGVGTESKSQAKQDRAHGAGGKGGQQQPADAVSRMKP